MKLDILEIIFLIFLSKFCNTFCESNGHVYLDYSNSSGNPFNQFKTVIYKFLKESESQLRNGEVVEVSYEIKPPQNANSLDPIFIKTMEETISDVDPSLDFNISSGEVRELSADGHEIKLLEYDLKISRTKNRTHSKDTLEVSSPKLENEDRIIQFIKSLYNEVKKTTDEYYSRELTFRLPPNSDESFASEVRKSFTRLLLKRLGKRMRKTYHITQKFVEHYTPEKKVGDILINIVFRAIKKGLKSPATSNSPVVDQDTEEKVKKPIETQVDENNPIANDGDVSSAISNNLNEKDNGKVVEELPRNFDQVASVTPNPPPSEQDSKDMVDELPENYSEMASVTPNPVLSEQDSKEMVEDLPGNYGEVSSVTPNSSVSEKASQNMVDEVPENYSEMANPPLSEQELKDLAKELAGNYSEVSSVTPNSSVSKKDSKVIVYKFQGNSGRVASNSFPSNLASKKIEDELPGNFNEVPSFTPNPPLIEQDSGEMVKKPPGNDDKVASVRSKNPLTEQNSQNVPEVLENPLENDGQVSVQKSSSGSMNGSLGRSLEEKDDDALLSKPYLNHFVLTPIDISDPSSSLKEPIIAELQRRRASKKWESNGPNSVLFTFTMRKHTMTNTEMNKIVEDIYSELKEIEPKSQIHPAHFKLPEGSKISVEVMVDLPPVKEMGVVKVLNRFPNVRKNSIELDYNKDLDLEDLHFSIDENIEYQLFKARMVDSGRKIFLYLPFKLNRKTVKTKDVVILVNEIKKHLKTLPGVKFISHKSKNIDKNWKLLTVKIAMKYSVNQAHEGLGAVPEIPGKKKKWYKGVYGWSWTIF